MFTHKTYALNELTIKGDLIGIKYGGWGRGIYKKELISSFFFAQGPDGTELFVAKSSNVLHMPSAFVGTTMGVDI